MEFDMTAIPTHIKLVAAIFVVFVIFQFSFQNSMKSNDAMDTTRIKPNDLNIPLSNLTSLKLKASDLSSKPEIKIKGKPRCGGLDHAKLTRPCGVNDTVCGSWTNKYWYPTSCEYQDISSEQARKCLGSRTLAFVGDTQIRDLAVGVSLFLLGKKIESSSKFKVDHRLNNHMEINGTRMPEFTIFVDNENMSTSGSNYLFPTPEVTLEKGYKWQVQYFSVFRKRHFNEVFEHILSNSMHKEWSQLKPIDLLFLSQGLQDYGWFNKPPYGERYYSSMMKEWAELEQNALIPSAWVGINAQCRENLKFKAGVKSTLPPIIDEVSAYVNKRTLREKKPYWDASAVLRVPNRCELVDDGVHVKMFVDIMRAKMLFNHLCDDNMNWKENPRASFL